MTSTIKGVALGCVQRTQGVCLNDRHGKLLPYQLGDKVQVRFTRRVDRKDPGRYYVEDPLYLDAVATGWPIYDDQYIETIGWGPITRVFSRPDPYRGCDVRTCWVRITERP